MNKTGHDASIVDLRIKPGIMDQPKRILRPRNELKSYAETPDVVMQEFSNYSSDSENDQEMPLVVQVSLIQCFFHSKKFK